MIIVRVKPVIFIDKGVAMSEDYTEKLHTYYSMKKPKDIPVYKFDDSMIDKAYIVENESNTINQSLEKLMIGNFDYRDYDDNLVFVMRDYSTNYQIDPNEIFFCDLHLDNFGEIDWVRLAYDIKE